MKIALVSDVHLEFGDYYPVNPESADVLILSGDIMVANDIGTSGMKETFRAERFLTFLDNCKKEYRNVVYVMGNHEHYHGDFAESAKILREECDSRGIHFLDTEMVTIDDVTFVGGTLWTDMNKHDELTMYHLRKAMNDFRVVKNSNRMVTFKTPVLADKPVGMTDEEFMDLPEGARTVMKFKQREALFSPEDAYEEHQKMVQYIRTVIEGKYDKKFVVVGHHAPSRMSTHPRYADDELMNGGYSSSLDDFIMDHPQIKAWTHGHTHEPFDYMIGSTRIVCNPRGYIGYERGTQEQEPYFAKVFEV
jgi:Icc-related predicted phosphoesterase